VSGRQKVLPQSVVLRVRPAFGIGIVPSPPIAINVQREQVLAEAVRTWVAETSGCDMDVVEQATQLALNCYRTGSTVSEACRQASGFIRSWMHHPSRAALEHGVVTQLDVRARLVKGQLASG
jgi:hypothetical protein